MVVKNAKVPGANFSNSHQHCKPDKQLLSKIRFRMLQHYVDPGETLLMIDLVM